MRKTKRPGMWNQAERVMIVVMLVMIAMMAMIIRVTADTFDVPETEQIRQVLTTSDIASDEEIAPEKKIEAEDFENAKIEAALKERAVHVGECSVTFYTCCTEECGNDDGITKSGVKATPEVSVAVDPTVIPLGSDVLLKWTDGTEQWCRADDTGNKIQGNKIDLCIADRADALNRGITVADVFYVAQEG